MNVHIFIIFVNLDGRFYLDKSSDNINKGTRAIVVFIMYKIHFYFFIRQLFQFYVFKNRNIITEFFYCGLKLHINDFDFFKDKLFDLI